jgi:hypothetical protein
MNELVSIRNVAKALGVPERSAGKNPTRQIRRRLANIAEERRVEGFQLIRVGHNWFTTKEDLRRLLPELFAHDALDEDSLRGQVHRQAIEMRSLLERVERVENELLAVKSKARAS